MTAETPPQDEAMNNLQPRRYQVRRLHDSAKLTQSEIAERLGISQATVNRDLKETVAPMGHTKKGTPFYPPGRFDQDPEYQERVEELHRTRGLNRIVARRTAAGEFAGAPGTLNRRGVTPELNTQEEKQKALDAVDEAVRES